MVVHAGPGMFFSDALRDVWHTGRNDNVPTGSVWEASVAGFPFLSVNDSFYMEAIKVPLCAVILLGAAAYSYCVFYSSSVLLWLVFSEYDAGKSSDVDGMKRVFAVCSNRSTRSMGKVRSRGSQRRQWQALQPPPPPRYSWPSSWQCSCGGGNCTSRCPGTSR